MSVLYGRRVKRYIEEKNSEPKFLVLLRELKPAMKLG